MTENNVARTGRPPTGSIVWADPETKTQPLGVRVTKGNGKRKLVRFDPGTSAADAIALAPSVAEGARFAVDDSTGRRSRSTRNGGANGARLAALAAWPTTERGSHCMRFRRLACCRSPTTAPRFDSN